MLVDPASLAHEIPAVEEFERAILDALGRAVGFDAAFFAVKGSSPTTILVDAHRLGGAIERVDYEAELAPIRAAALRRRGVAIDTDVLGETAVRACSYHRDFAAPVGGRHSLLGYPALRGAPMGGLMLGRTGSTFRSSEVAMIEELLPRLAVARASYGLPVVVPPLPSPPALGWRARAAARIRGERVLAELRGGPCDLLVRDRAGCREMVAVDGGGELVWSRVPLDAPDRSGWFYVDLLHLAATRAAERRRFLFVGVGGGVVLRQFARVYPGAKLDAVEHDPRVVDLATRWFGLGAIPRLSVRVGDGVEAIARASPGTWDAVVIDAYDGSELAAGFEGRAFARSLRRALQPGGGVAFNVVGRLADDTVLKGVERALRSAFDDVRLVPVLDPGEAYSSTALRNVVVLART